ncbi:OmpP1/FadL family transporter [Oryzifoliimicrobium ureilyticus]|uniref:OmpP1/FadL family transporter n=1 Tax=Oryzifoliimicrobium ureilyticus TaxID=3113724 RepID=UPI0030768088
MSFNKIFSGSTLSLALVVGLAAPASAGGLERGGYDIDQLFDSSQYSVESGVTYVSPHRKLKNARDINPRDGSLTGRSTTADDTGDYAVPYLGIKAGYGPVDCLVDYSQPFGATLTPGDGWVGAENNIETRIRSNNYGGTCSYKFDMGPGQFRIIGGGFYQEINGSKERIVLDPALIPFPASTIFDGSGRLTLHDSAWGWRAGIAYEIPEYAMRASLIYNSRVKYDNLTGTLDLTQVPPTVLAPFTGKKFGIVGSADAPDSLEMKLQSGIAPDWLAFGSVKWTNWSVLQSINLCPQASSGLPCPPGGVTSLGLYYQDGWTISGGIGHKFNDQWAGAVSLAWDRGTSTGYGAQTDTWTLGVGAAYTPTEHIEWRLGGAIGLLTSGSSGPIIRNGTVIAGTNDASYSFGNDIFAAVNTSIKFKF